LARIDRAKAAADPHSSARSNSVVGVREFAVPDIAISIAFGVSRSPQPAEVPPQKA
jgi:hypothetical protein